MQTWYSALNMSAVLPDKPTLSEMQAHLQTMCEEKGWDKNSVTEVFLLFSEEVGELAKAIRRYTGFKGEKKVPDATNLEEEFADVLNYLMELANRFEVDLEAAYRTKSAKNESRIWE